MLCRRAVSVRPSVLLSAAFVYCVEASKYILKLFTIWGSDTMLVSPYQTLWQYADRDAPNRGV